jgi:hypothetical protein
MDYPSGHAPSDAEIDNAKCMPMRLDRNTARSSLFNSMILLSILAGPTDERLWPLERALPPDMDRSGSAVILRRGFR